MTGAPVLSARYLRPSKGSRVLRLAKRTAHFSCSSVRTFTQNFPALAIKGWLRAARFTQTSTIGGVSETLAYALAGKPLGPPSSSRVVSIVTPVGKRRMTARKASVVTRRGVRRFPFRHRAGGIFCGGVGGGGGGRGGGMTL